MSPRWSRAPCHTLGGKVPSCGPADPPGPPQGGGRLFCGPDPSCQPTAATLAAVGGDPPCSPLGGRPVPPVSCPPVSPLGRRSDLRWHRFPLSPLGWRPDLLQSRFPMPPCCGVGSARHHQDRDPSCGGAGPHDSARVASRPALVAPGELPWGPPTWLGSQRLTLFWGMPAHPPTRRCDTLHASSLA